MGEGAKFISFPRIPGFHPVRVVWGLGREKVRSPSTSPSDLIPTSIDAIKSFLRATKQKSTTLLYDKKSVTVCFHHSPATLARIWKRGFLIPHFCSIFTKITHLELLPSPSPNIIFFLNPHPCLLANSASRLAVKSRICQRFPESRTVIWSNPASRQRFPESRPVF